MKHLAFMRCPRDLDEMAIVSNTEKVPWGITVDIEAGTWSFEDQTAPIGGFLRIGNGPNAVFMQAWDTRSIADIRQNMEDTMMWIKETEEHMKMWIGGE